MVPEGFRLIENELKKYELGQDFRSLFWVQIIKRLVYWRWKINIEPPL